MVYKLYLDGENIDAEFGRAMTFSETFIGKYGSALKKADEMIRLIDFGTVTVLENGLKERKPVYVVSKNYGEISKKELN